MTFFQILLDIEMSWWTKDLPLKKPGYVIHLEELSLNV